MKLLRTVPLLIVITAPLSAVAKKSAPISQQLPKQYTVSYEFEKKPSGEKGSITLSSNGEALVAIQRTPYGETQQLYVNGKTYYTFTLLPSGKKRAEVHKGPAVGLLDKVPLLDANLLGVDGIIEAKSSTAKALVLTRRAVDGTAPFHAPVMTKCSVTPSRSTLDAVQRFNAGGMEPSEWDGKLFEEVRYNNYRVLGTATTPQEITSTLYKSGGANIESDTISTRWKLKKATEKPLDPAYFKPEKAVAHGSVVQDATLSKTVAFEHVEEAGSLEAQANEQRSREEGHVEDQKSGLPPHVTGGIALGAALGAIFIWLGSRRGRLR